MVQQMGVSFECVEQNSFRIRHHEKNTAEAHDRNICPHHFVSCDVKVNIESWNKLSQPRAKGFMAIF